MLYIIVMKTIPTKTYTYLHKFKLVYTTGGISLSDEERKKEMEKLEEEKKKIKEKDWDKVNWDEDME